jgi:uncharacterized membrane protein YqhA
MIRKNRWLVKILNINKWFVIPAILIMYLSSALLVFAGFERLFLIILGFIAKIKNPDHTNHLEIVAGFIGIIDIFILAIVMYTLAVGIYKLFLGNNVPVPWIEINNLNDLKTHLAKMSVIFLSTMLIQKITEWKEPKETLFFAISISLISVVLIWYIKQLKEYCHLVEKEKD